MRAMIRPGDFATLASFHKIADAIDLQHPLIGRIIRENLVDSSITVSQRSWEFAMAYAALETAGCLDGSKVGVSFGAGFEQILYALSMRVAKLHATDLYFADSVWKEAQTADARAELALRAEIPWDPATIEITHMDMRDLTFPDNSLDFAYSISAIEHIGNDSDFLDHLREAKRVLKPDGIYVLTTTMTLLPDTIRQEGCYLFAEPHIRDLVREAGFSTPGPLGMEISGDDGNIPCFKPDSLDLPSVISNQFVPQVNILYRGAAFGACCLLLVPDGDPCVEAPEIAAVERSRKSIVRLRDRYVKRLWSQPVHVTSRCYKGFLAANPEYFVFTEVLWFGEELVEWQVTIGSPDSNWSGRVLFFVQSAPTLRPDQIANDHQTSVSLDHGNGDVERIVIRCPASKDRGYALIGRVEEGEGVPSDVAVTARVVKQPKDGETDHRGQTE